MSIMLRPWDGRCLRCESVIPSRMGRLPYCGLSCAYRHRTQREHRHEAAPRLGPNIVPLVRQGVMGAGGTGQTGTHLLHGGMSAKVAGSGDAELSAVVSETTKVTESIPHPREPLARRLHDLCDHR